MSFYRRWIVASTAGELVGIGVATGAALAITTLIGEPRLTARLRRPLEAFNGRVITVTGIYQRKGTSI
jgi:hypothetical protein